MKFRTGSWLGKIVGTIFMLVFVGMGFTFLAPHLVRAVGEGETKTIVFVAVLSVSVMVLVSLGLRRIFRSGRAASEGPESPSISEAGKRRTAGGVRWAGAIFAGAGVLFSLVFLVPLVQTARALFWPPVDCEIVSSAVRSGSDGDTYSVEVTYRYEVDGAEYVSDRYRFLGGSSSGVRGKQRVVDRLPPGTRTTCWVDPSDPSEAVLSRRLSWEFALLLLPMIFVVLGGLMFAYGGSKKRESPVPVAPGDEIDIGRFELMEEGDVAGAEWLPSVGSGPRTLEPALGPAGKLGCATAIALLWNGLTGVFVYHIVRGWMDGSPDGCLTIFILPFVLVGLALLLAVPYQFLALANPRPTLTLDSGGVPLGGSTAVSWRFQGATHRLRTLEIRLEGQESATYRRGTTSTTDTRTFASISVYDSEAGMVIDNGSAEIEVPLDTMHSFQAPRNAVRWRLVLHGAIRRWPDVLESYDFAVLPAEGET